MNALNRLGTAALVIGCLAGIANAKGGDAVRWSAPGWYVIRWVQEDVAYDLMRGPFRARANCDLALTKFKARDKNDAHTIECREFAASPP